MGNKPSLYDLATSYIKARRLKINSKSERDHIATVNECTGDLFCWSVDGRDLEIWKKHFDDTDDCNECMVHEKAYRQALKDCALLLRKMERLVNKRTAQDEKE